MNTAITPKPRSINNAMIVMVSAMTFAPIMDAIAKFGATEFGISPATITLGRFTVQSLFLGCFVVFVVIKGSKGFGFSWINVLRGMIMGLAALLFFTAVKYMPLADAISVFFVEPLIVMLLSSMFLGETVGWRRRLAALIGFGGALIVIQPSYELFGLVSLLPLCTAFLFSVYLILTRMSGSSDDPIAMQFYAGLGGILTCGTIVALGSWLGSENFALTVPESSRGWALLLSMGLLATASHMLIVIAFSMAPASILAPFQYVEIVSATILGWFIFGDFPGPMKWVGILIIIGSGAYIFWREQQIEKDDHAAPVGGRS